MPIERFDADVSFPDAIGQQVIELFKRNCVAYDRVEEADHRDTLQNRSTTEKLNDLLECKTFYVAKNIRGHVCGVLECDVEECDDATLAFLWWLIVDEQFRGHRIASSLHQRFEKNFVPSVQADATSRVLQALAVHPENPAKKIYERWGYEPGEIEYETGMGLFMTKRPEDIQFWQ